MKRLSVCAVVGFLLASVQAARVDVYPQSFDQGGWALDAQFMDVMGSPYLLADGLGVRVTDAKARVAFPEKGGAWVLSNSEQGKARVCIPWSVCQGYGVAVASGLIASRYPADTVQDGPNRKSKDRVFPSIAYSGDDWRGRSETAKSTLTVVPPSGEGVSEALAGTGALPFSFDKTGKWRLALEMAEGTMLTATINLPRGFLFTVQ